MTKLRNCWLKLKPGCNSICIKFFKILSNLLYLLFTVQVQFIKHANCFLSHCNTAFNRLAKQTKWGESALRHQYYVGLAERIKDILATKEKPSSLRALKDAAKAADARHWERQREKSRSGQPSSSSSKSEKPDNKKSSHPPSNRQSNNSGKSSSSKPSNSGTSGQLSDKLGKDGKLTAEEHKRRFDNNLCLFCGSSGHRAKECPKSSSSVSKTKARTATVKGKEKE